MRAINKFGKPYVVVPLTSKSVTIACEGRVIDLPLSIHQFEQRHLAWKRGMLIQHAFPELTDSQREFLMTGSRLSPDD